jgi:hypothetical protein
LRKVSKSFLDGHTQTFSARHVKWNQLMERTKKLVMTPRLQQMCISITEKLIALPCAACFVDPPDPDDPEDVEPSATRAYFQVINCPVDLNSILNRLKASGYETVDKWDHDVSLIWYNAEKYNGRSSFVFFLAHELCRHYTKLTKPFEWEHIPGWTARWLHLEKKMLDLLGTSPKPTKSYLANHPQAGPQEAIPEEQLAPLAKALKKLRKPADVMYVNNMLMRHFSRLHLGSDGTMIDLRILPPAAVRALHQYTQNRYTENNWSYPLPEPAAS